MTLRDTLRRLGAGRAAYYAWHLPRGKIGESMRQGGPLAQWRTSRGRREMEEHAHRLPALDHPGPALELHVLTGRRFWYQTAFCLWSFGHHAKRQVAPTIYDDGTLESSHVSALRRTFPEAKIVWQRESVARLDEHLPAARFPVLRERWLNYPNIRKLLDIHAGTRGWKLVVDSDMLFFGRPAMLVDWLEAPDRPLHAVDCVTSYGYQRPLLERLAGKPLAELVNVGLIGLHSEEIDWGQVERWCAELIAAAGTHYYLEQALAAMLVAGRECAVAPASEYVTFPKPPEAFDCRAVMHHYVDNSKQFYFRRNWRRVWALADGKRAGG